MYSAIVVRRARRHTFYVPVWQDWVWYGLLPSVLYATLAITSSFLPRNPQVALFVLGAAALGFLLNGIRNAWDTVTHVVVASSEGDED